MTKAPEIKIRPRPVEVEPSVEQKDALVEKELVHEELEQKKEVAPKKEISEASTRASQKPDPVVVSKNDVLVRVEEIMSENLAEAYQSMTPAKQAAFKAKGEEIASKVQQMIDKGHLRIRKVLRWIRSWLKMIPGVNSFFLEQEAKIKTDRLLAYYKKQTGQ